MYNQNDAFRYVSDGILGFYTGMKTMLDLSQKLTGYLEDDLQVYLTGPIMYYFPSLMSMNFILRRNRKEDQIIFCAAYCMGVTVAAITLLPNENAVEKDDDYIASRSLTNFF